MNILLLTSVDNSMSQRAYVELTGLGHEVSVALASSERAMFEAVEQHSPELIVAPMLKRAIPEEIWREQDCIIVHPDPRGDRGPSSPDWAILEGAERWGVTLLQANAEMDAGDIWASHTFPMRPARAVSNKEEVIGAAMRRAVANRLALRERKLCPRTARLRSAGPLRAPEAHDEAGGWPVARIEVELRRQF